MNPVAAPPNPAHGANPSIYASTPTRATLFWRTFLPWQLWKFVSINWRMLRVISKGHARGHSGAGAAGARRENP